jgi:DNA-binding transcriptional regulator YhcF (GntR family)
MTRIRDRGQKKYVWRGPSGATAKRSVSWLEIERAILLRIARKEYSPGQKISTCEELAAEFGANKNTVSKAYRSLAERGYLLTQAGFGTFISKRPLRVSPDGASDSITDMISLAVQEAKFSGLREGQFRKLVDDVIARGYGHAGPRVGFIDCNRHDATILSRDLQAAVSHPIEPLLIDDVVANATRFLDEFDVLAVDITHLATIEALPHDGARVQIISMHIPIDPESLLQVARMRPGTRVGLVCDLKQTLVSLTGLVGGCNPALHIDGSRTSDKPAIRHLLRTSDLLLVTPSAMERVQAMNPQIPTVMLAFRPDMRSVEQLSAVIAEHATSVVSFRGKSISRSASGP